MRALQFVTDHVILKLRYNQIHQMITTNDYIRTSTSNLKILACNRLYGSLIVGKDISILQKFLATLKLNHIKIYDRS